jgi:hypothetical protein
MSASRRLIWSGDGLVLASRSVNVNADLDPRRSVGRIPTDSARTPRIDEWYRSNSPAIW